MPLYDYKCTKCGTVREVRHGFHESHDEPCAECGAPMTRVFSAAPVVFKGSGFYVNDSRKSGDSKSDTKSTETKSSETKSAETKSAETKSSETKSSESKSSESAA